MNYRFAAIDDCPLLGQLNFQLIHDEGHRNPMSPPELAARMERWLTSGEYKAVIFQKSGETVAYASFRQEDNQTIYPAILRPPRTPLLRHRSAGDQSPPERDPAKASTTNIRGLKR